RNDLLIRTFPYLVKSYRHCDVDAGDKRREVKQSLQCRLLLFMPYGNMMNRARLTLFFLALMPRQNAE
ncbi:hypothetical protein, partial [Klebsiella variicola]|uniref:hypothetical protein n=1 Tax=Klebsiella variicola TaxID=244366 RepID=UPI001C4EA290